MLITTEILQKFGMIGYLSGPDDAITPGRN